MHLTDCDVGILLDPHSDPSSREVLETHVASCLACRRGLSELQSTEELFHDTLLAVDVPAPRLTLARLRSAVDAQSEPLKTPRLRSTRMALAAAGFLATVALADTVTRGPLTHLVTRLLRHSPTSVTIQPVGMVPAPRGVGIWVDSAAEVDFRVAQASGEIALRDGPSARLSVEGSTDGPQYTVRSNGITVNNRQTDRADYVIEVPPAPVAIIVRVDDHVIYERRGGRVVLSMTTYHFASGRRDQPPP